MPATSTPPAIARITITPSTITGAEELTAELRGVLERGGERREDGGGDAVGEVVGRIGASDDEGVTLDVAGAPVRLAYAEVTKALVQIEFNRPTAKEA